METGCHCWVLAGWLRTWWRHGAGAGWVLGAGAGPGAVRCRVLALAVRVVETRHAVKIGAAANAGCSLEKSFACFCYLGSMLEYLFFLPLTSASDKQNSNPHPNSKQLIDLKTAAGRGFVQWRVSWSTCCDLGPRNIPKTNSVDASHHWTAIFAPDGQDGTKGEQFVQKVGYPVSQSFDCLTLRPSHTKVAISDSYLLPPVAG